MASQRSPTRQAAPGGGGASPPVLCPRAPFCRVGLVATTGCRPSYSDLRCAVQRRLEPHVRLACKVCTCQYRGDGQLQHLRAALPLALRFGHRWATRAPFAKDLRPAVLHFHLSGGVVAGGGVEGWAAPAGGTGAGGGGPVLESGASGGPGGGGGRAGDSAGWGRRRSGASKNKPATNERLGLLGSRV